MARAGQKTPAAEDRKTVKTLLKGLQLLDLVANTSHHMSLTEIADRFPADIGTVHRMLNTLVREGYLAQDPYAKRYFLSAKILQLGRCFFSQHRILDLARDTIMEIASLSEETVQLSVIASPAKAVLIHEEVSTQRVSVSASIGADMPMHCSAHGKMLLAAQSDKIIGRIIDHIDFKASTPNTITSPDKLRREVEVIRQLGYATEEEEFIEGARAIAAPIYTFTSQAVCALGVTGPASRFTKERMVEIAGPLIRMAWNVSLSFGYIPEEE